ncbi:MAG TPA: TAT-variant-translocated molybdopterin oxidoreductase [Steroidobacteraceae bacterium]
MSPLNNRTPLWRSLEEAGGDPGLLARATQEFPMLARALADPVNRREVLKLMAACIAWSGLAGCDSKFGDALVPPVRMPPNVVPGRPNFFATAQVLGGYAQGIVVEHVMGRPLKVAGNPHHPASLGATDAYAQALPLDFYDPDRAAQVCFKGNPSYRAAFDAALATERARLKASDGAGLKILTGNITSPCLLDQIESLLRAYPEATWVSWEPLSRTNAQNGTRQIYGTPLDTIAHLDRADIVLAFDADLLSTDPGRLRYARDLASRRNPARGQMNRIYAVESTPTLLGSVADHRFIAEPSDVEHIVAWLLDAVRSQSSPPAPAGTRPPWMAALIEDLKGARGKVLIHAGAQHSAAVHAQVHLMNESLLARNATYTLIDAQGPAPTSSPEQLLLDMHAGKVTHLLMLDTNPAYSAPFSWDFAAALKSVPFSVSLARHLDETAQKTTWFVPLAHSWESWGDARAYDASVSILQPQSLPLYDGLSAAEVVDRYLQTQSRSSEAIVKDFWRARLSGDFAQAFDAALAKGVLADTAARPATVEPRPAAVHPSGPEKSDNPEAPHATAISLVFRADPSLWDGRFANNPWLQELPRPLAKDVWGNPLRISPALAEQHHLETGDVVLLKVGEASVTSPVIVLPGQAPHTITALLGSGRSGAGRVGDQVGVNFHPFTSLADAVRLEKTAAHTDVATTVHHNLLTAPSEQVLRHQDLSEFLSGQPEASPPAATLYETHPQGPAQWAMSIDLNACIGCNACVVACQAENNIPVVGKAQVLREREMHWLRIDRYLAGDASAPESFFQPVLCMHCEQAPCENVCPVGATVHDAEGLNVMVYNRCVGTRFCSNNCPYKVRRFNFDSFAREQHRPRESWNPEVTVRARGVMEKCSYCIQRIAAARIEADRDSKPIGKVTTACEAACPTRAFTFGNLADPESAVLARKRSPLDFAMLSDEATKPRTTYEAKVRNPNPKLKGLSA